MMGQKNSRHVDESVIATATAPTETDNNNNQPKGLNVNEIKVLDFNACIERATTAIDESSQHVVKYKTPHFSARSTLYFPKIRDGETWEVGFIQGCTHMTFINAYGNIGRTSWEFPHITTEGHTIISDSDGSCYPWYGPMTAIPKLKGPCAPQQVTVEMNDNFHPHVTWSLPVGESINAKLTHIQREQSFHTWLVVCNVKLKRYYVLRSVIWDMFVDIDVDTDKPRGSRAKLNSNTIPGQPVEIKNISIPICALNPPNCNGNQQLVWRGPNNRPVVVIPSSENHEHKKPSPSQQVPVSKNNSCSHCRGFQRGISW